jgi:hypothetical protein
LQGFGSNSCTPSISILIFFDGDPHMWAKL